MSLIDRRKSDSAWYYKLSCGHIRLIDTKKLDIVEDQTKAYCVQCDKFAVVKKKDGRW